MIDRPPNIIFCWFLLNKTSFYRFGFYYSNYPFRKGHYSFSDKCQGNFPFVTSTHFHCLTIQKFSTIKRQMTQQIPRCCYWKLLEIYLHSGFYVRALYFVYFGTCFAQTNTEMRWKTFEVLSFVHFVLIQMVVQLNREILSFPNEMREKRNLKGIIFW